MADDELRKCVLLAWVRKVAESGKPFWCSFDEYLQADWNGDIFALAKALGLLTEGITA